MYVTFRVGYALARTTARLAVAIDGDTTARFATSDLSRPRGHTRKSTCTTHGAIGVACASCLHAEGGGEEQRRERCQYPMKISQNVCSNMTPDVVAGDCHKI